MVQTETLEHPDDFTPVDLLLWRRFQREVPGLLEQTLRGNPGLSALGACPPRGTKVVVILPDKATRVAAPLISLWSKPG